MFKVGDKVKVITNPKGTLWEKGVVYEIKEGKALINYGFENFPVFDIRKPWKNFEDLEFVNENKRG